MTRVGHALLGLLGLAGLTGCFNPPEPLCEFSCELSPNQCPAGYECRADHYCHKVGTSGICPGFPGPDAAVDAPADTMADGPGDGPTDGPTTD